MPDNACAIKASVPKNDPPLTERLDHLLGIARETNEHLRDCTLAVAGTVLLEEVCVPCNTKWENVCALSMTEMLRDILFENVQLVRKLKEKL